VICRNRTRLVIAGVVLSTLVTGLLIWKPWRLFHWTAQERFAPFTCALYKWGESEQSFSGFAVPRIVASLARAGEIEKALDFAARSRRHQAHAYADILLYVGAEMDPALRRQVLFKLFFAALAAGPFVAPEGKVESWRSAVPITMLTVAGQMFAQENLPHFARACFIVAERRARLLPPALRHFHFSNIGFGYILLGEKETGQTFLDEAERAAMDPSSRMTRCELWRSLGLAAAEAGLQEYLDSYLEKDRVHHQTKGESIEGFGAALWAGAYIKLRNVDGALDLARRNENKSSRIRDLCDIADIMLDNGDETGARKLAAEIDVVVMNNNGLLNWRADAAARFAQLLARIGEDANARKILEQAETWLADPELEKSGKDGALADVAAAWCRIGECGKAFELLKSVEDDEDAVFALLDIFVDTYSRKHEFSGEELDAMVKLCPEVDL
jgi:hypothetical protein